MLSDPDSRKIQICVSKVISLLPHILHLVVIILHRSLGLYTLTYFVVYLHKIKHLVVIMRLNKRLKNNSVLRKNHRNVWLGT